MFSKKFLTDTAERVIATMAQTLAAAWGVETVSAFNADWRYLAGVTISAGVLSLAKCLYAYSRGDSSSASLVQ